MQDRKALQAGTSHFLGQNFAKASGILFQDKDNAQSHAWTTSWGVSTRLVGGMIMTHGDDDGMIMPPRLASSQIVIIPVTPKPETRDAVIASCKALKAELEGVSYAGSPLRVQIDDRDIQGGVKKWEWVKKGVPVRIEVGPRDVEAGTLPVNRRDTAPNDKQIVPRGELAAKLPALLQDIQDALFARAKAFRKANTVEIDTKEEFYKFFASPTKGDENENTPIHGGFAMAHFNGDPTLEQKIKDDLKVTVRCIPLEPGRPGTCPFTGQPSAKRVVWAKAY
jgi:prolyl-tRNA synthetase